MMVPKIYSVGKVRQFDPVHVIDRDEDGMWLRFDGDQHLFRMPWHEYANSSFLGWIKFDADDLEEWGPNA